MGCPAVMVTPPPSAEPFRQGLDEMTPGVAKIKIANCPDCMKPQQAPNPHNDPKRRHAQ